MFLEIRKELLKLSEDEYKKFSEKLIPGVENYLGVRIPILRKLAEKIIKNNSRDEYINSEPFYFEEIMIQGILIGSIKSDFQNVKKYIEEFTPKINNWSVCDAFCTGLKISKKNLREMWEFIQPYFLSKKEYEARFATVMYLKYFIQKDYIESAFNYFDVMNKDKYYIQMAVAWAVAETYLKFPDETMNYLKKNNLDKFTYNKAVSKICDSFRVGSEEKIILKAIKKK